MKLVVFIFLMTLSITSFACEQYEAQFVGFVSTSSGIDETGCELDIDFDVYNMHFSCPLLIEEAINMPIKVEPSTCKLISNTHTSGYLVRKAGEDFITLEQ